MKKIIKLSLFFAALAAGNLTLTKTVRVSKSEKPFKFGGHEKIGTVLGHDGAGERRLLGPDGIQVDPKLYAAARQLNEMLEKSPADNRVAVIATFLQNIVEHQHKAISAASDATVKVEGIFNETRTDGLPKYASPGIIDGSTDHKIPKGSDIWFDMHGIDGGAVTRPGAPVDVLPVNPIALEGEEAIARPARRGKFGGGHGPVVLQRKK